ncbi:uncharacterized protein HKW66_Vig0184310 [Vigna angularis]|uniref:Uncharacterized protein n=1 Tax=Phaseolus angularis TaxID=3914 RepID=A0A8T0KZG7_PHAAN|nr:uncharacterized protein HKW66_Vig0184310 [Vigna angularis]
MVDIHPIPSTGIVPVNSTVSGTHHCCCCRVAAAAVATAAVATAAVAGAPESTGDHTIGSVSAGRPPLHEDRRDWSSHAPPRAAARVAAAAAHAGASPKLSAADQHRRERLLALFLDLWSLRQSEHFEFLGFLPLHGVFLVYKHLYWWLIF